MCCLLRHKCLWPPLLSLIHEIDMFTFISILAIQEERQGALWGRSAFSRTVSKTPWCLLLFRVFIQPFIFQTPLSQASFLLPSHCFALHFIMNLTLHYISIHLSLQCIGLLNMQKYFIQWDNCKLNYILQMSIQESMMPVLNRLSECVQKIVR